MTPHAVAELRECLDLLYAAEATGGELHALGVLWIREVLERHVAELELESAA